MYKEGLDVQSVYNGNQYAGQNFNYPANLYSEQPYNYGEGYDFQTSNGYQASTNGYPVSHSGYPISKISYPLTNGYDGYNIPPRYSGYSAYDGGYGIYNEGFAISNELVPSKAASHLDYRIQPMTRYYYYVMVDINFNKMQRWNVILKSYSDA